MLKKDCSTCEMYPEFAFFSPTTYAAVGFCPAFDDEDLLPIFEVEKKGEEGYDYVFDGEKITDCPCWCLEEEYIPESDEIPGVKFKKEPCFCGSPSPIMDVEELSALDRAALSQLKDMITLLRTKRGVMV